MGFPPIKLKSLMWNIRSDIKALNLQKQTTSNIAYLWADGDEVYDVDIYEACADCG